MVAERESIGYETGGENGLVFDLGPYNHLVLGLFRVFLEYVEMARFSSYPVAYSKTVSYESLPCEVVDDHLRVFLMLILYK